MKLTKNRLRESIMYHSTSPENINNIQQYGLEVGSKSAFTIGGAWADEYYGTRPIYISMQKGKYEGQPLAIDVSGMGLVADLPGLVDIGAIIEEEGVYWNEGSEPQEVMNLVDEDGMLYFEDLLDPNHPASHAAIELTGTAASLESIPPSRIKITEGNIMKLTKNRIKQIIREELEADSDRPSMKVIEAHATWQATRLAKWAGMDMPGMETVTDSILRDFRGLADPETHSEFMEEFGEYYPGWEPEDFQILLGMIRDRGF